MRIAIVSDIHANIYALNTFLEYVEKQFQVTDILNLGDFLQIGPYPREVMEILIEDKRFINILGGSETSLLHRDPSSFPADEYSHQDWTIEQLGPDLMGRLYQISKTNIFKIGDKKLLMVHSRPYRTNEMPLLFQGATMDDFIKDYINIDADYILFGHTHLQALINSRENLVFINPGSLGCSVDSSISFCLVELNDGKTNFIFKNINYDNSKLKEDYMRLKVPAAQRILKVFHGIDI
jgi:putative phosphoesterase